MVSRAVSGLWSVGFGSDSGLHSADYLFLENVQRASTVASRDLDRLPRSSRESQHRGRPYNRGRGRGGRGGRGGRVIHMTYLEPRMRHVLHGAKLNNVRVRLLGDSMSRRRQNMSDYNNRYDSHSNPNPRQIFSRIFSSQLQLSPAYSCGHITTRSGLLLNLFQFFFPYRSAKMTWTVEFLFKETGTRIIDPE
jgi:hypothetical protein